MNLATYKPQGLIFPATEEASGNWFFRLNIITCLVIPLNHMSYMNLATYNPKRLIFPTTEEASMVSDCTKCRPIWRHLDRSTGTFRAVLQTRTGKNGGGKRLWRFKCSFSYSRPYHPGCAKWSNRFKWRFKWLWRFTNPFIWRFKDWVQDHVTQVDSNDDSNEDSNGGQDLPTFHVKIQKCKP